MKLGAFEHLLKLGDRPVEGHWLYFKETTNENTKKVVGFRRRKQSQSSISSSKSVRKG